jgi:hypothetical protein
MDDLTGLSAEELAERLEGVRAQMRPLEQQLAELRGRRDLLLTERRRRERVDRRQSRETLRSAMGSGELPSVAELVAGSDAGGLDEYAYSLKTGGEVALGFPGARAATLAFTDGVRTVQARDLGQAAELYAAGWELGSPGRPGVRVHFPGTRQERLVDAAEVFARPREQAEES